MVSVGGQFQWMVSVSGFYSSSWLVVWLGGLGGWSRWVLLVGWSRWVVLVCGLIVWSRWVVSLRGFGRTDGRTVGLLLFNTLCSNKDD